MRKLLLLPLIICLSMSCSAQEEGAITSQEFKKVIEETKNIQLIDVRTQGEFDEGKIGKAKLIDFYNKDFRAAISKLDKNKPIAVYCAVGGRSGNAARMLKEMGFTKVYDLKGGIIDWQKTGYKLVKD